MNVRERERMTAVSLVLCAYSRNRGRSEPVEFVRAEMWSLLHSMLDGEPSHELVERTLERLLSRADWRDGIERMTEIVRAEILASAGN